MAPTVAPPPSADPDQNLSLSPSLSLTLTTGTPSSPRKMASVVEAVEDQTVMLEYVYNLRLASWWGAIALICGGISMVSYTDYAFQWHVHLCALCLGACATACSLCVHRWTAGRAAVQHAAVQPGTFLRLLGVRVHRAATDTD